MMIIIVQCAKKWIWLSWVNFTNDFSTVIQMRWKSHSAFFQVAIVIAKKFWNGTTAVLSWHVQNFVTIWYPAMELHLNQFSIKFGLWWKNHLWNVPLTIMYSVILTHHRLHCSDSNKNSFPRIFMKQLTDMYNRPRQTTTQNMTLGTEEYNFISEFVFKIIQNVKWWYSFITWLWNICKRKHSCIKWW